MDIHNHAGIVQPLMLNYLCYTLYEIAMDQFM